MERCPLNSGSQMIDREGDMMIFLGSSHWDSKVDRQRSKTYEYDAHGS